MKLASNLDDIVIEKFAAKMSESKRVSKYINYENRVLSLFISRHRGIEPKFETPSMGNQLPSIIRSCLQETSLDFQFAQLTCSSLRCPTPRFTDHDLIMMVS
jgi:hypothetical protein